MIFRIIVMFLCSIMSFTFLSNGYVLSKTTEQCVSSYQPGMLKDLMIFPQSLKVYSDLLGEVTLISGEKLEEKYSFFKKRFFQPWDSTEPIFPVHDAYVIFSYPNTKSHATWWAENLLPWTEKNWKAVEKNAARSTYPSCNYKGIITERTAVRAAPTVSPFFRNPSLAGEGFPFDYLMEANIHLGTPVFVTHISEDEAWVFIETPFVSGWVRDNVVAKVNSDIIKQFSSLPQASIIYDGVLLKDASGVHGGTGFLGTVLPMIKLTSDTAMLLVPVRDQYGNAHIITAETPKHNVLPMPQVLTPKLLASIGESLIGQPYGWGGLFGRRDCSEMISDLFIPFGVWLPRNSQQQVHERHFINLEHVSKEKFYSVMKTQAVPFVTLIGFQGHVGLYLGMYNDTPVMLHDLWGVHTIDNGHKGRYILGRVIISSLDLGNELCNLTNDETLFNRLEGISILN